MAEASGLMRGRRGLIMGVANNRSLAWGIARACRSQGAEVALTYQGDAHRKRVEPLAAEIGALLVGHCDVADPASIDAAFEVLKAAWGDLDFIVHAIAFSDRDQLDGRYVDTTPENFARASPRPRSRLRYVISPPTSGVRTSASTPSHRDRSRRWQPPASGISATS
jgi:enoyl-[acyl-carrier protein] reductase I